MKSLPVLLATALLALAALALPGAASASKGQLSLFQDDRELLGFTAQDPGASMEELKGLGVDIVRTNVIYYKIYRTPNQRRKPSGFNAADPNSPEYDWSRTDRLVDEARARGIKLLFTVTGPGPHFTSEKPGRCRAVPCAFRPKPAEFGKFASAVAKRYRGRVTYYSIWNEPNLNVWLTPQQSRPGGGRVQTEAVIYRKLFQAGQRAIAKADPGRRNRVLFGETAAIGEPLSMMRAALCLDEKYKRFRGSLARRHGCGGRVAKLNIGGFAIHPYNFGGYGTPRQRTGRKTALPIAHMPRLHKLIDTARRLGRITRRAPIFSTEFGFQTRPPDRLGRTQAQQAQFINEADRLLWSDRRVATVAQYELTDPPELDQFNSGLRFTESKGRQAKASYDAYRLPLVVTRRSSNSVEVFGQVRPGGRATAQIQIRGGDGQFTAVRSVRTNGRGYFRVTLKRSARAKFRLAWQDLATSQFFTSRVAKAGKPLKYQRG